MLKCRYLETSSMETYLSQSLEIEERHLPLKRAFDIAFSVFALLFFFPLFLGLAIIIRLTSKGPAIYAHERIGRGGKTFRCFKFRSMYADSDERLKELLKNNPEMKEEWDRSHKLKNDPRITPIGKFIRKTSLDEFPQFLNVLKGDLSVVGPRPVVRAEVNKHLKEKAPKILSVRPGLTGIWQVSGRSNTTYAERIMMDEAYIDSHNLWLDIKLIAKTVPAMLSKRGAY